MICGPSGANMMPMVTREVTFEIYKDRPFDDGRSALTFRKTLW